MKDTGGARGASLDGQGGADKLVGGPGTDTLTGGDGNGQLDGCAGDDTMTGGADNDTYTVDSAGDIVIEDVGARADQTEGRTDNTPMSDFSFAVTGAASFAATDFYL